MCTHIAPDAAAGGILPLLPNVPRNSYFHTVWGPGAEVKVLGVTAPHVATVSHDLRSTEITECKSGSICRGFVSQPPSVEPG